MAVVTTDRVQQPTCRSHPALISRNFCRRLAQRIPTAGVHNLHVKMTGRGSASLMATCPRCLGALDGRPQMPDGHVQPRRPTPSRPSGSGGDRWRSCSVFVDRKNGRWVRWWLAAAALGAGARGRQSVRPSAAGRPRRGSASPHPATRRCRSVLPAWRRRRVRARVPSRFTAPDITATRNIRQPSDLAPPS